MFGNLQRSVLLALQDLDTPVSKLLAEKLIAKDWDGLSSFRISPRNYTDPGLYMRDAAAVGLFKKLQGLPTSFDKADVALKKWYQGERDCYLSNQRLEVYRRNWRNDTDRVPEIESMFREVRAIIKGWIGDGPSLDRVASAARFGPGATFVDRGRLTTVPDKMTSAPTLTHNAVMYLLGWVGTAWSAASAARYERVQFVEGNRWSTAPKDSSTDRSIGSEAPLNIYFQLGVGTLLRDELHRGTGWNLKHAQSVHREVARLSSMSREFDTHDLSNASDTVCRVLVELCMPHRWLEHMLALRSPKTLVNGKWVVLEKFSSMGNGYTFELESTLFAALACWASRKAGFKGLLGEDVFILGDDIIVKHDVSRVLVPLFRFCGFTMNDEKSFTGQSPFRESCGGDYWYGHDVRPYHLKTIPNEPQELISFANGWRANMEKLAFIGENLPMRAWFAILDELPRNIRDCRGPKDLGDIVIHDAPNRWQIRVSNGIRLFRTYRVVKTSKLGLDNWVGEVQLASALYGVTSASNRGNDNKIVPRKPTKSYGVKWTPFS